MNGLTLLTWIVGLSVLYVAYRVAVSLHSDPLRGESFPEGLEPSDYEAVRDA